MYWTIVVWLLLLAWPAVAVIVDGAAGVRAHGLHYQFGETVQEDFRVLVPIWGDVKYLTNADALHRYGTRVTLVTTGDETPEFYRQLHRVALAHDFDTWHDAPTAARGSGGQKRRATSGTTRDRLIRNVLATVTEPYVIPLDADSFPGGDLALLAGELDRRGLDIASVRIMPGNPAESVLTRLQMFEYWLAMQIRFIAPWLVSGACQVARTPVLADVMAQHSLFFQGNDVEIGLISEARGYRIGHIAFEIKSDVPATFRPWARQRLAWAGGQFRLFIVNIRFARRHPFLWFYGAGIATLGLAFRWQVLTAPPRPLLWAAVGGYGALVLYLYLRRGGGNGWVLAMPFYVLLSSFLILPLGPVWYVKMALAHHNWGVIRPGRRARPAKPARYGTRRAPRAKITGTLLSLAAVVVGLGAIITGGFTALPHLPTGVITAAQAAEQQNPNVLKNPAFSAPARHELATYWKDEHSTAIPAEYRTVPGGQQITYAGQPGDTGPGHKLEVFQAALAGVRPGQQWRFAVTIQGTVVKSYTIAGMEWFTRGSPGRFISASDVYPHVTSEPGRFAVTSPPLPGNAVALAVYVQLPEINPATAINVTISNPSLTLAGGQ